MKTSTLGMKQASVTSAPLSGTENATQQSNIKLSSHKHHLSIVVLLLTVFMLAVPKGAHAKVVRDTINFTSNSVYTPNVYNSVGNTRNASTYDSYLYEHYNLHYSNNFTSNTYQYATTGLNIAGRAQGSAKTATFSTEAAKIYISKETKAKIRNAGSPASNYSGTAYFKLNGEASDSNYDYSITKPVAAGGSDMIDNAFNLPNHTQSFTISIYNTTSRSGNYYYGRGSIMYLYLCKLIPEVRPSSAQDYNGGYAMGALEKSITTAKQTLVIKVADGVNPSDFDAEIVKNEGSVGTFTITDKTLNAAGTELTIKFTCATGATDGAISANLNVSSVNELDDKEYTVAISGTVGSAKEANTLAWNISTSQFVNTTYAQAAFLTGVNSTENVVISSSDDDVCEIINSGASIRFKAAGTVTLRAQQAENADYEGADESITVTVSKRTATFAYSESTLFTETEYPGLISVTNDPNNTLLPNLVYSGADTYMTVNNAGKVTTKTARGNSVTLNITFAGNTEWNAVSESHTFKIVNKLPAPEFCLSSLENIAERMADGVFVSNATTYGTGSFSWTGSALRVTTNANYMTTVVLRFDGIPNKLNFTLSRAVDQLGMEESDNGTSWSTMRSNASASGAISQAFNNEASRYVRINIQISGGGTVDLNNLCITAKPTFTVSPATAYINTDGVLSTPATLTIVHNDMRSITITSSDPDFVVSPITTVSGSPIGADNQGTAQATVDFVGTDLTKTATLTLTGVPSTGTNVVKTVNVRLNATHATHYALGRAIVASESGSGRVYVGNNSTEPATNAYRSSSERLQWCSGEVGANDNLTFHYWAKAADGYEFEGWYGLFDEETLEYEDLISSSEHFSIDLTAYSTDQDNPTTGTLYAVFAESTAAAAPVFALEALNLGSVVSSPDAMLEGALVLQPVGEALRPLYIDREQTTIVFSDIAGHEGESALFAAGSYSSGAKSFAITFTPTGLHPTTHTYQTLATVTATNEKGTTTHTAVISATVNPSPAATYTLDASHTFSNLQRNQHETWNAVLGSLTNDVGTPTISITGTNAAMFSAGAYDATNHLFPITFAPTAVGNNYTATATITVLNYDGVQTQKTITLTGTCVVSPLASFDVQNADGESVVNASGVYYGDFNVGDLTSTRTFYIKNLANMKEGSTPSISISPAGIFSASAYNPTLNTFAISFTAVEGMTTVQNAVATFTVLNNDDVETEKQVPLSAFVVVPVDFDVRVTSSTGTVLKEGTWAEGLEEANKTANAGCTLTLMRNITLTATTTQAVTNTFTLDLNGKALRATINGSVLNPKTAGKTLTIMDSKGSGIIENITTNYNGIAYGVNISAGTVVFKSGTIHAENTAVFNHSTLTGLGARGVKLAADATFNMSGGTIEAVGGRYVYGIYEESSKANSTTVNITGGTINAEAPAYVYGIGAYGKVNISGGTINVKVNTATVNSNATYVASYFNDNTLHRYGYGIMMYAQSNATATECYFGTLTMTGGTINVTNENKTLNASSALTTEHTYGVYMNVATTGAGAGKTAPDGTKVQKACAIGSIDNATINITHTGVQAYGVFARGCYNSFNNTTTPLRITNSNIEITAYQTAYGVYADAYINWSSTLTALTGNGGCTYGDIELNDCVINATTTGGTGAYGAWINATSGTVANAKATTGSTSTGNATYYGEYAVAGKITVNSGTYTATATSSAYAIGSADRAKSVRNVNGAIANRDASTDALGSLGGNAEAYPELNIHGGSFSATTETSTAVAVKSGGTTVIDGGTFSAYAGSSDAYGLRVNSGKTTTSGVDFTASATTKAYGVYVTGTVSEWSLFAYSGDVELNNTNVTATTRTTTEARALYVDGATRTYTQASFEAMRSANNSNYKNYGDYAQVGERSVMGKASVTGGRLTATAATTTAYGALLAATKVSTNAVSVASGEMSLKNVTFDVKTNGTTTAYGVYAGGPTTIDGCDITVLPKTTTAYGVYVYDKKTTVTNTSIDVKGTTTAYGFYANAAIGSTTGWDYHGELDLGSGNDVTVAATAGNTAHVMTLFATKKNIASGTFAGDYANAATAIVRDGKYKATATGTTTYVLNLSANQVQGAVSAAPSCTVEGGKFWAKATGGTEGICTTNAVVGNIVFNGGYYNISTNLAKYVADGKVVSALENTRSQYTEGYRYEIGEVGGGTGVCQINSTKYKTLEEALQFVNANSGTAYTIYMIADYTLPAGDYVLPAKATLLVPYTTTSGKGGTTAIGAAAATTTSATTPSLFRKLTFANGANLTCLGIIETSAQQKANGQYGANVGMPSGPYGQIDLKEGSHISLENGAKLYCWGYITGKGTIDAKRGSTSLEGFQLGDWCGGSNASSLIDNSQKVFPITHYFYQSIECPITYRPGAKALGSTHINVSIIGVVGQDAISLVGTSGSMFLMDDKDASADTWVMKDYDETTDQCVWTINSGASIGNLTINISSYNMASKNYDLPITTNMTVVMNYGEMGIGQNAVFLPGSKLIINKEGTAVINGVTATIYDAADWTGTTRYFASYSPTWGTANPRKSIPVTDAEVFVHGKVDIRGNGGLYTTAGGANVHSTNADAGQVIYTTAAQSNKTSYYLQQGGTTRTALTVNPAKLLNGDGTYATSAGTVAGKTWTYIDDTWQCWSKDGCFFRDAQDNYYANPAAMVRLSSGTADANHLYHDAATTTRNFVWDENCYWWEVETTPATAGIYQSLNADHNGKYNYYEYNTAAGCWKIKTLTVTFNVNGTNTNYTVNYGTKPKWLGATPTKSSGSSDFSYAWDGWTQDGGSTVYSNTELPIVTANTTFTAHFYESYLQYNITFKNDDGQVLESKNWNKGSTPSYSGGTPEKEATASQTFTFSGSWSPTITAVTAAKEYTAQYNAATRQYDVTFLDYDNQELETKKVNYNATPTFTGTPSTPERTDPEDYYIYEFSGWKNQLTGTTGLAAVTSDQTYVAQYSHRPKWFNIRFVDYNGTTLKTGKVLSGTMPTAPADPVRESDAQYHYAFKAWSPAITPATENKTYTATYNTTLRSYTVRFLGYDDTVLQTETLNYGVTPSYKGSTPTKPGNVQYHYDFIGWDDVMRTVSDDKDYTAQFNEVTNQYAITFKNYDGTVLKNDEQDYGIRPQAPATPSKPDEGNYSYVFAGWVVESTTEPVYASDELPLINGIATYVATYNEVYNKPSYTITFLDPELSGVDKTVYTTTVLEGEALADPSATLIANGKLQKAEDAGYTYVFDTWTPALVSPVTAAATYTATYRIATTKQYTIAFYDENGTELQSGSVSYGTSPTPPTAPTKESDEEWDYSFDWWYVGETKASNPLPTVSGAVSYTARYSKTHRRFTATFVDEDGTVLETVNNVEYGTTPVFTQSTPTKATDEDYTYAFGAWTPALGNITTNTTFTATYTPTERFYGEQYKLDIVEWSANGANQSITLNMNNYSLPTVKTEWTVQVGDRRFYNAVYSRVWRDNRTLVINNLTLTPGEYIVLKVRGAEDACVSRLAYTVPYIYNANATLTAQGEMATTSTLCVNNGTLTINADITADQVLVSPGASLTINAGKTLTVNKTMLLRTTPFSSAVLLNNGSLTLGASAQMYYSRIMSDNSQSYQWGLPFNVDLTKTRFSNGTDATQGRHFGLMYYDAESRAQNGKDALNWVLYSSTTQQRNTGYQMIVGSPYYFEIYFPVDYSTRQADGATISVTAYGDESNSANNRGWNYIVSPYTHVFNCGTPASPEEALKISVLNSDNETFTQYAPTTIQPAMPFYYQAEETGTLDFTSGSLRKLAPRRMSIYNPNNDVPTQWIELLFGNAADELDKSNADITNIYLHPTKFSAEYELGYDVAKLSTQGARPLLWAKTTAGDLAFAALPDSLCRSLPLAVSVPTEGLYTFALNDNGYTSRIDNLILLDALTGTETDLRRDTYSCLIEAGQTTARFFLIVKMKESGIATDTDNIGEKSSIERPVKLFIDGYIYILMPDGRMYDAVGKRVK